MNDALKQTFIDLKEKILDLPFTPHRSMMVDQIDAALDSGNFMETLLQLTAD